MIMNEMSKINLKNEFSMPNIKKLVTMRNYNTNPVNKKVFKENLLKCPACNKKYKSETKRQQHVEKCHYYDTRNDNQFKLTSDIRAQIFDLAASYVVELYEIRRDENYGESFAKNLLPQLYGESIKQNDLLRIMAAQKSFANNLLDQNLLSCNWSFVMDDLERFFNLGLPYYDTNFCPTLAIDFLWHAMMQRPELYVEICKKSCIDIMPHCNNYRSDETDAQRHEYFLKVFSHRFNKMPIAFPSQLEAFSIDDIQGVFYGFRNRELEKVKAKHLLDETRKKENDEKDRLITERYILKREREDSIIKIVSECFGFPTEKLAWGYERYYYLQGYEMGLRDETLREYAENKATHERNKPSTC